MNKKSNKADRAVTDDAEVLGPQNEAEMDEALVDEAGAVATGYLKDFISGLQVRATPEEVQATQVFSRRLVEDFGYPKSYIITRPQFRVSRRPSDVKKSYPVDIAVFSSESRLENDCIMIVECKSESEKTGRKQLEMYLTLSDAYIGVWFNGKSHLYIHKYYDNGKVIFKDLPTLPRFGQRVEDIGLYKRSDLEKSASLKAVFRDIRHHLAGNTVGITHDIRLAHQIINVLFCKIYDETTKGPDELVEFRAGVDEAARTVRDRVLDLFSSVKTRFNDVFDPTETIELDEKSLAYVVGELQPYCITESERDAVGDAFEVFMGPALRGEEGQFFTPRNVVKMIVDIVDPQPEELVIDPACGTGGFLVTALDHVWKVLDASGTKRKFSPERIREEQRHVGARYFRGIEKDTFLAKVAKAYMAILGDGRGGVHCASSLHPPGEWPPLLRETVKLGTFDVVLTNPPFGAKIPIKGVDTLRQFTLGFKAKRDKDTGKFVWTDKLHDKQPPQILFIERCLQLLKPGGRMGIVLPESVLGMPTYTHIVQFLRERVRIVGVVSMPDELFQPHTHAKTAVLFVHNSPPRKDDKTFMSVVEWCGHDSRGNPTVRIHPDGREELLDDIPNVSSEFKRIMGNPFK
ncbi:N-6 DNA methylase [Neorhizobium sp. P12A]|uniref:restriction endonuclease subunit M n=1 Tax=Neorhizobium sp. P12A TaxID=2268027 RepID=UPI00165D9ECD|nr:N-6 DNA methylase [Neorhizobium sp. P12A]